MAKKEYNQKPSIKLSPEFKDILMKLKIDLGFKDLDALIKSMYEIIIKNKLIEELKDYNGGLK